jgi:hypothetical protein
LRSDLGAGSEYADDQRRHNKERKLSSEWPHERNLLAGGFCKRGYFPSAPMSTAKNAAATALPRRCRQPGSGVMLDPWQRRMRRSKNGRVQVCAPIARTPGEFNPIAAQYSICASCPQRIRPIENIRRCR